MTLETRKRIIEYCKNLTLTLCPSTQLVYLYTDDDLPVDGAGKTRKEAQDELAGDIEVLWGEYVDADIETLAPSGVRLRENLIKRFGGRGNMVNPRRGLVTFQEGGR